MNADKKEFIRVCPNKGNLEVSCAPKSIAFRGCGSDNTTAGSLLI